jgi:hypothetical protein
MFQLGLGLGSGLPGESSNGRPFLVADGDGFELLVFGGDLAGQRMRVRGLGVVVPVSGVGGLSPGVGFVLGGKPQLTGHLGWGLAVQDAGFELAAGHVADAVGFVADFPGADGSLPHAFEFGGAAVPRRVRQPAAGR